MKGQKGTQARAGNRTTTKKNQLKELSKREMEAVQGGQIYGYFTECSGVGSETEILGSPTGFWGLEFFVH